MSQSLEELQKKKVLLRAFSEDLEEFGRYFFPNHLKLETPVFHKDIYKLYQGSDKRIAIGAPRGHAKSTITDLVYLSWLIVNNKAHFILLVSDTYSQAVLFLDTLKAELEANEKLQMFYGKLTSNSWSEGEIITNGIMIKSLGAGMKVRGFKYHESRPDVVVVDDLENDELVENKDRREKLERWFNGALVPSIDKDGRLIMIGTVLHYDSLLYKILDPKQYTEFVKRTYKAINPEGALWPEHLNLAELEKIKEEYAQKGQSYLFYQEYQNNPVSEEDRKFKPEKLKYYEEDKLEDKVLNTYVTVDRAYSAERLADSTGILVVSVDINNNWYVRLAERFKGLEKDLIQRLFELKDYYNPLKIGIEQKAFKYTIQPNLEDEMRKRNSFFNVLELKDGGRNKNMRIEGLLPRYDTGSIYFKREQADLIDELVTFPKAIHDDLADALAYQLEITTAPRNSIQSTAQIEEFDMSSYGEYGLN